MAKNIEVSVPFLSPSSGKSTLSTALRRARPTLPEHNMVMKRAPSPQKPARHFAEGGVVRPETPDELMARMSAKYGAPAAGPAPQPPVAQPVPPVQQPQTKPQQGPSSGIFGIFKGRAAQIDKAAGYANGGTIGAPLIDPNGSDFDAINAEKTQRWAAEDAAKQGVRGPATGYQNMPVTTPAAPAPAASLFPKLDNPFSSATTFQQDSDARQSRITAYADRLKAMEVNGRSNSLMGSSSTITRGFAQGGELGAAMAAKGLTVGGGGKLKGPGTPTSDSIDAQVRQTGEPIKVSTDERIVSKAQSDLLDAVAKSAGYESLDGLFSDFGLPVGPTIKGGKRAAATGMAPDMQAFGSIDAKPVAAGGLSSDRVAAAIAAPPTLGGGSFARSEPVGALTNAAAAGAAAKAARDAVGYRPEVNGITWNAKGFDPTKETMAPGTGAIAITSGPNAGKNIAVGPQNYTAADGTPTSDWSKTAQYAQGMAQAQKDRDTLATMQRDRLERDAYAPSITDPNVQAAARQQIQNLDAKAAKQGEAYGRMLDNQIKTTKLVSEGAMAGLQAQYLNEQDSARRNQIAEQIRAVTGKGEGSPAWQHVETDKGVMAFNPKTARMEPIRGPDGAPVAGSKPLTEFQGKSTSFGMRADAASKTIDQVGQGGKIQPSLIKRAAESVPLVGEGLGMAANRFASPEQQQVEQAQRDFINAVLRQESGAAISASEFDNARKQYFAQPNDSQEVVAQKKANREMAINGFRISAGPGAKNIGGAPAPAQQPAGLQVGTVDGRHVYIGGDPANPASWKEVR